jgi:hypothetical protein
MQRASRCRRARRRQQRHGDLRLSRHVTHSRSAMRATCDAFNTGSIWSWLPFTFRCQAPNRERSRFLTGMLIHQDVVARGPRVLLREGGLDMDGVRCGVRDRDHLQQDLDDVSVPLARRKPIRRGLTVLLSGSVDGQESKSLPLRRTTARNVTNFFVRWFSFAGVGRAKRAQGGLQSALITSSMA